VMDKPREFGSYEQGVRDMIPIGSSSNVAKLIAHIAKCSFSQLIDGIHARLPWYHVLGDSLPDHPFDSYKHSLAPLQTSSTIARFGSRFCS